MPRATQDRGRFSVLTQKVLVLKEKAQNGIKFDTKVCGHTPPLICGGGLGIAISWGANMKLKRSDYVDEYITLCSQLCKKAEDYTKEKVSMHKALLRVVRVQGFCRKTAKTLHILLAHRDAPTKKHIIIKLTPSRNRAIIKI